MSSYLTLAADIVSAHVGHNSVSVNALPSLIQSVYASLADLGKPVEVAPEKREPAVSIRASVKPDALTCLECGTKMKMLKRHLASDHGLTPAEYAARRKELAVKIGLGRKPKAAADEEPAAVVKAPAAKAKRAPRKAAEPAEA